MNIREISDIFKDTADNITAIKSYNFGWASDRVRQGNTEDFQELNEFPRVFFAVPTITGSDQTRKQDTYQVTIFFDDLLGYDNEGDEDPTLQIDKWANLQQYANYFVQRLNKIKQSILPNYLFIPEAPSITFDSFTGLQRMITVQLSFNLVVPTNCDPGVIAVVECIANIVTSSNLTASLTTVLKFAASLEGRATVTADINFVQKVASSLDNSSSLISNLQLAKNVESNIAASSLLNSDLKIAKTFESSLNANGTLVSDLKIAKNADALLNANASLTGDINFVQKVASSLNANALLSGDISFVKNAEANLSALASLSGDINFVQKAQASLLATGTTTANLTVGSAFDADAAAFFARVTAAGGTLTATEQTAVNTLVVQMKADGIWTKMKAIYPMVGGGQANPAAACAQNLKSASFTGTFSRGITFANTGVKGNGTSSYMDTGINLSIDLEQNNSHACVYSRSNNQGPFASFGVTTSGNFNSLALSIYLAGAAYYNMFSNGGLNTFSSTSALGMRILNRINSTTVNYFTNLSKQTRTITSTTGENLNIWLLARNFNITGDLFDIKENAFFSFGNSLTDTEANNFYTAVQAFQISLNRQVV